MNGKIQKMRNALNEMMQACEKKRTAFMEDQRTDEAVFEKVEANVYEIFRTVLEVGTKVCGEEEGAVKAFLLTKLDEIPGNWEKAYELAKQHDDAQKMKIEGVKLDAAKQIRTTIEQIWEETND